MGDFRLLLDGQQRATSLTRTLKGIDEVWIIFKNEDELPPEVKSKAPSDRALEQVGQSEFRDVSTVKAIHF